MMDFQILNRELGPATVASHVVNKARDCPQLLAAAARHNPLVPVFIQNRHIKINAVFDKALTFIATLCGKKSIILTNQELELVEVLCKQHRSTFITITVMADAPLCPEVLARMRNNLPHRCSAEIVQVPNLPKCLQPETLILAVGALAGCNYVLLPEYTLNALEILCRNFWGDVVLLDPVGYPIQDRATGWLCVQKKEFFTGVVSPLGYTDLDDVMGRSAA